MGTTPDVLADAVRARRVELGWLKATELAGALGMSPKLVQLVENGGRENYRESTLLMLDKVLRWPLGSAQRALMDGVVPVPLGDDIEGVPGHTGPMYIDLPDEAVGDLSPGELAEVKAAATAAFLERARSIRATRTT